MKNQTIYGLIGCGMMGQEHLRNIALLPGTQIGAIYEPDETMRTISAGLAPEAEFPESIDALLSRKDLDCILIASPNFCHLEQMEEIARSKPLPILVEKPLYTDPDHLERVNALIANYPAPIWVAMEYRYMPPISAFLERQSNVTGGIKMLTIREHRFPFLEKVGDWNRFNENSGGTFVEKCCHFFDLMRLILASEPVRVMGSGGQDENHLNESYDGKTPDILDNGYVIVDFENGARAMLELCMFAEGSAYQEVISAVGPKGKIEAMVPGPTRMWSSKNISPPIPKLVISPRDPSGPEEIEVPVDPELLSAGDHNGATYFQHQKFLDLVQGNAAKPEVNLDDGKIAVLMGIAAQISMAENRVVEMSELT